MRVCVCKWVRADFSIYEKKKKKKDAYNTSSILKRMALTKYALLKLHKVRSCRLIKDSLPPPGESKH